MTEEEAVDQVVRILKAYGAQTVNQISRALGKTKDATRHILELEKNVLWKTVAVQDPQHGYWMTKYRLI